MRKIIIASAAATVLSGCAHTPNPCWDLLLTGSGVMEIAGDGECGRPAPVEDDPRAAPYADPIELVRYDEFKTPEGSK